MEDYRLYGMDASDQRFKSRSERRARLLDQPPKPRKSLIRRLVIFAAVVVGVSFVLAIVFIAVALFVLLEEGGYGNYDRRTPAEMTAHSETRIARWPSLATRTAATKTAIAVNTNGESSARQSSPVRNGPPNPPTDLYVSLRLVNSSELEWKAPASSLVTGYRLERKTGDGVWETIQDDIPAEFREITDGWLQSGTSYTYRVVALNEWSESAPSAEFALSVP